jgi:hypothetical protein
MKTYTRLDKIDKIKFFLREKFIAATVWLMIIALVCGYAANVYKIATVVHWGGLEVLRVVGLFFFPLGAILGYC